MAVNTWCYPPGRVCLRLHSRESKQTGQPAHITCGSESKSRGRRFRCASRILRRSARILGLRPPDVRIPVATFPDREPGAAVGGDVITMGKHRVPVFGNAQAAEFRGKPGEG